MLVYDVRGRVWSMQKEYNQAHGDAGFGEICDTNPSFVIGQFTNLLQLSSLKMAMDDVIFWTEDEQFRKKVFNEFRWEVPMQAKILPAENM